ncbi:MAG: copper transporter [Actinomycetes bacterium]|jgi:hypothetical protein|nr:copper transporter [Actinomycetes bacterium]
MYNFKYHIASIAAVFLALALGLLLGGLIADKTPTQSQDALIKSIQTDIADTRKQNAELTAQRDELHDFSEVLADNYLTGRLDGITVLILGDEGDEAEKAAVAAIAAAGGTTVTTLPMMDGDTGTWSLDLEPDQIPDDYQAVLNLFEPLQANAEGYFAWVKSLALNGRMPLASAAIESEEASLVRTSWDEKIAATDQLDTDYGVYSVVTLLSGGQPGLYGALDGATALYPSPAPAITSAPTQ